MLVGGRGSAEEGPLSLHPEPSNLAQGLQLGMGGSQPGGSRGRGWEQARAGGPEDQVFSPAGSEAAAAPSRREGLAQGGGRRLLGPRVPLPQLGETGSRGWGPQGATVPARGRAEPDPG